MIPANHLPNLIIAGVNKAGTTSLHTYLSWHPDVYASKTKETNYFVPLLYDQKVESIDQYTKYFKDGNGQKYRMESTPKYIFGGGKLAKTIHGQLGMIKIVFLLRDPIHRLFSYYRHMKDNSEIPRNIFFDDYVGRGIKDLDDWEQGPINVYKENVFIRGLAQGFYSDYLMPWFDLFGDSARVYFFEDLKRNPALFMKNICHWLELDPSLYRSANFSVENRRISYRSRTLHRIASILNDKLEGVLRTYFPLKKRLRDIYYFINESAEKKESISNNALEKLRFLYEPYNLDLRDILTHRGYGDFPEWLKISKSNLKG